MEGEGVKRSGKREDRATSNEKMKGERREKIMSEGVES
jgi:hypothetical protein